MTTEKRATVRHAGGLSFVTTPGSGHALTLDASPEHGGGDSGPTPMESVLAALAACTGIDVISILRKARQDVTEYRVEARGLQAEEHPRVFTEVEVVHRFAGRELSAAALERAVTLSSTKYCPVSAMLGWGAKVTHRWEVVEVDAAG